ncbi:hypothetical protein K3495_g860 [Podosphaera aphanis]|nr:hypothetical protein K3495_g860 [Podosphaera aphanis]
MDEKVKGGTVVLKLRETQIITQGTSNQLPQRKRRGRPRKDQKINEKENDYTGEVMDGIQLTSQSINIPVPIAATSALDLALIPNATPALISEREPEKEQELPLASVQESEQIPAPSLSPVPTSISVEIPKPTGKLKATGELIDVNKKKGLGPKKKPKEKITNPKRRDLDPDLQSIAVNKMEVKIEHKNNEIETNDVDMKNEVETRNDEMENKTGANDNMKENQSPEVDESSKVLPISVAKIIELHSTVEAKPRYFFRNRKPFHDILKVSTELAFPVQAINGISIPKTYEQAVNDKIHGKIWKHAISTEIEALLSNSTWEEQTLPTEANLVSTKWVFTIKLKNDGTIERYKARSVARGFSQQLGIDYTETFAPTVRMDTFRLFLAMVAIFELECHHYDIKNVEIGSTNWCDLQGIICLRRGHIFVPSKRSDSLKRKGTQSPAESKWTKTGWKRLKLTLEEFSSVNGFEQNLADPCLYVQHEKKIWILVYVDEIAAAAKTTLELTWFFNKLSKRFNAKNLGEIEKILGVRIMRDRKGRCIYLDQEQYPSSALDQFGITHAKDNSKKIPAADYENVRPSNQSDERIDVCEYQKGIGKLMYAMILTRPDIAFVLGRLSQSMKDPAVHHGIALKSLMRYLRSTIKQRLRFGPGGAHPDKFAIYTDADWATDKSD